MNNEPIMGDHYFLPNKIDLDRMLFEEGVLNEIIEYGLIVRSILPVKGRYGDYVAYECSYISNGNATSTILPKCLIEKIFNKQQSNQ